MDGNDGGVEWPLIGENRGGGHLNLMIHISYQPRISEYGESYLSNELFGGEGKIYE